LSHVRAWEAEGLLNLVVGLESGVERSSARPARNAPAAVLRLGTCGLVLDQVQHGRRVHSSAEQDDA